MGYVRDIHKLEEYLNHSTFLPYLNNEKQHENYTSNKDHFIQTNAFMMVKFLQDTVVYPKETE